MLWKLAGRDVFLVVAALSLFAAVDAWSALVSGALPATLAVVDGVLAALVAGYAAHEWGHLAGARLAGAAVAPGRLTDLQLFRFDLDASDLRGFRWMSVGGNAAPWLVVALFGVALPLTTPGQVALFATSLAGVVFANLVELPVLARTFSGVPPRTALEAVGPRTFVASGAAAGAAGFLVSVL